jgi:hypothetical protein
MKFTGKLRFLTFAIIGALGTVNLLAQGATNTVVEIPTAIPTVAVPVPTNIAFEFAPLGVSLSTVIELDEPNPLALPVPMPPLAINPGTTLTLRPLSTKWTTITNVIWTKNGEPMANAAGVPAGTLILPAVTSAASGSYRATFTGDGTATGTVVAYIIVHPGINHPLTNISTRATISPANPQVIVGFSIPENIESEYLEKRLLIRAVGQTLSDFGVENPLLDPMVRIFDADGNDVTPDHIFAAVIYEDGTTPESHYYGQVAAAAAAVGAFYVPVPTPESPPITDYSDLVSLPPGTYTVVVTSDGGQTGDVLVEVYEVGL